ncbi:uncharacterized protein N7477_009651 [Penicillium maclennaniae]|uniref:uncharacterized protein n=1 Tax=Penicillium maclennaniae TaxID=1343394 RepID=UPI0025415F2A|nr:uncharacterized protein N7477_009651 [Penicillium maclennaniae]KAJ5662035.1 hypothetical protein N7477_009651 [Penicillium maclennaniae]
MESEDNTKDVQGASSVMRITPTGEEAELTIPVNPKVAKKKELTERSNNGFAEAKTVSRVGLGSPFPTPKSGETEKKLKPKAIRHSRDKFEKLPFDFPDEKAELTDDQIRVLIMQAPCIRKRYYKYFTSQGRIKQPYYHVIFTKKPDGELLHEDWVMNSNLLSRWENVMQCYEYNKARESSGKPSGKRQSKPNKKNEAGGEGAGPKNDNEFHEQPSMKSASFKKAGRPAERLCTPASEEFFETLPNASNIIADTDEAATIANPFAEDAVARQAKPGASGPSYRSRSRLGLERLPHSAARIEKYDDMFLRPERRRSRSPHDSSTVQNKREAKLYDSINPSHSMHRYLDNETLQSIRKYEMGDLELMNLGDLSAFVKRMDRDINKLQASLMQSSEIFESWQIKKKVNEFRTSLLALQVACLKLQEQLEADDMGEQ